MENKYGSLTLTCSTNLQEKIMGDYADMAVDAAMAEDDWYWDRPEEESEAFDRGSKRYRLDHWLTKDQGVIPITSMSDNHLKNTINMLLRKGLEDNPRMPYLVKEFQDRGKEKKYAEFCDKIYL